MNASFRNRRRAATWGCVVAVLLLLVLLATFVYHRYDSWRERPTEARRIAESITVAGFSRTVVVDVIDSYSSYARAYFIGPAPKPDPLAIIAVPTMQLHSQQSSPLRAQYEEFGAVEIVAKGQRGDGCEATVSFVANPIATTSAVPPVRILTDEQRAAVRSGSQILIGISVNNCGW